MARYIDVDKMHEFNCPEIWKSGEGCPDEDCAECFYNNGGAEDVAPVGYCKNCKYFKEITFDNPWDFDGMCMWFNTHAVCKNDFCSRYESENG